MRNDKKMKKFKIGSLVLFFALGSHCFAQDGGNEAADKQLKKAEEKGRRRQASIQTKKTRKRMKSHAQESRRINENKPKFFWQKSRRKRLKKTK